MGSELDPIISTFKAVAFVVTAPWDQVEPYISRILWLVIIVLGVVWTWKKIKTIK